DFIDKILDEVLGQDRHEWTSAYDWDDALADVEVKMAALKSGKCLHQIAEPAAQGLDAARYHWLREQHDKGDDSVTIFIGDEQHGPGHLDAQIDEAIAAQAKQGGAA
ncbi:MAG: hypothetical protein RSB86_19620, partial [Comamonas sp.]